MPGFIQGPQPDLAAVGLFSVLAVLTQPSQVVCA